MGKIKTDRIKQNFQFFNHKNYHLRKHRKIKAKGTSKNQFKNEKSDGFLAGATQKSRNDGTAEQ